MIRFSTLVILLVQGPVAVLSAQDPPPPPPPDSAVVRRADSSAASTAADSVGIYSDEQARRGQQLYSRNCVECHSASAYTGSVFRRVWGSKPAFDLWEQIRTTMPEDNPGKLSPQEYADIVAYLLKLNRLPAGPADLPGDPARLQQLMIRVSRPGS